MAWDGVTELLDSPRQLWIVLAIKFMEGLAFVSLMYILAKYLSDELGFSDVQAGWLFAFCSGMQLPFALGWSTVLDAWGVRRMCVVGEFFLLLSRLLLWLLPTRAIACVVLLFLYPIGTGAVLPALTVGVKRFSTERSRPYAFAMLYSLFNVSSLVVAATLNVFRDYFSEKAGVYRAVLCLGCIASAFGLVGSPFLTERDRTDADSRQVLPAPASTPSMISAFQSRTFWRFLAVVMSFVMIRMVFGHLNATVPKWMTREFGERTPYELYIGINPALIIVLVPICTRVCEVMNLKLESSLLCGALISGFSPFILAFVVPSTLAVIVFIVVFSVGEAIWSPKLLEYAVAVPQEGREGIYVACGSAPLYLAKFMAGATSGYLLQQYCPKPDAADSITGCRTRALWLAIALTTSVTPIALLLFRSCLFTNGHDDTGERSPILQKVKTST